MYIRTFGQSPIDEGKYQSDAAMRQAAQELFRKYESACWGIDILKHLTRRGSLGSWEEGMLLQRRFMELPKLFEAKAELDRRARIWQDSPEKNRVFSDPVAERRRIEEFVQRTKALSPELYRI